MQMNRWLTPVEPEDEGTSRSPVRPRASVWIDPLAQQNISASYIKKEQRVIRNPQTPIPARASAVKATRSTRVRPRYARSQAQTQDADVTRIPTLPPPTMWQYELPDYEAESSLSSLSLAHPAAAVELTLDELDTMPPPRVTEDIAELDTVPPLIKHTSTVEKSPATSEPNKEKNGLFSLIFTQPVQSQRQKSVTLPAPPTIDEIATLPPGATTVPVLRAPVGNQKLDFLERVRIPRAIVESSSSKALDEARSWTTGQGKNSLMAKRIASRGQRKSALSLNPLDRLRWWLLYPGRIEFLLWLSGTIVLVGVTCVLLFATLLSTGWLNAGLSSISAGGSKMSGTSASTTTTTTKSSCTAQNANSPRCNTTTVVSASGLKLTLVDNALLLPDMPIYLRGQGFTTNNTANFTYDASLPCRPDTIATDTQGSFSLYLMLGAGAKGGVHQITAYDAATKHTVTITVDISPAPMGKAASPTPTSAAPGVTPTATSGAGGGGILPTPVGQTPVPITPTIDVKPTIQPTQQPSPTIGIRPSPTIGITPTVGIAPTTTPGLTPTAGTQHTDTVSLFKNTLYDAHVDGHNSISIWLWIAVFGYAISMTMLGCAGILYRRNRRISSK